MAGQLRIPTDWQRVSRRWPCPVCGKPDWCLYLGPADAPSAAICARIESPKRRGEAGWLHVLEHSGPTWSPRIRRIELSAARIGVPALDLDKLVADFRAAARPTAIDRLGAFLGVSAESLTRLGIGWSAKHRGWAFPMSDVAGHLLGIRLRLPGGKKLSVKGGKEGLFLPEGFDVAGGLLLVAEGITDTAALSDLGFNAVGRPSCTGGVKLLVELVRKHRPANVVIVADADGPGQHGAENLARQLVAYVLTVRIVAPPTGIKDARAWLNAGATTADVLAAIEAAPLRQLTITVMGRGSK